MCYNSYRYSLWCMLEKFREIFYIKTLLVKQNRLLILLENKYDIECSSKRQLQKT